MTGKQYCSTNQQNKVIPILFLDRQQLGLPLQSPPQFTRVSIRLRILLCLLFLIPTWLFIPLTTLAQTPPIKEDRIAIQNAHDFYYSQKYSKAIEAYKVLLKTPLHQHSKDAIRMNLGRSYEKLGDDAVALQSFHAVIDDDPDGSYASQAVHRIGALFRDRYQYKEAITRCRQLANKYPKTQTAAIARYLIAQYTFADGGYDEAIESYRSFLNDFPTSPYRNSALNSLIRLYRIRHRYTDAEKLIQTELSYKPNDVNLMDQLADLYKAQEKYDKALSLYRAALDQNPKNTDILKKLGELYAERGQQDLAAEQWAKIVQDDPDQAHRYQQLGSIYTSHQMYRKAVEVYETALNLSPKNAQLYNRLADVYKIQGQIDMAVNTYLRALSVVDIGYSGRDTLIQSMAEIYEGAQQKRLLEGVIDRLQVMLRAASQNPSLVLSLAEAYFYRGDLDLALGNFKRLHQLYTADRGRFLEKYAQILERNKNPKAADFYQAIAELFPNTHLAATAQMKLVRFYERWGRWEEALTVLTSMTLRNQPSAQLALGHAWLHGIRDPGAALQVYQALANQPLSTDQKIQIQLGAATCYILQGKSNIAEIALRPIADGNSNFKAEAQKLIGDAHLLRGDIESAVAAYKRVLDIAMSNPLSNDSLDRIVLIQSNSDYSNEPLKRYLEAMQSDLSGDTDAALQLCHETMKEYPMALIVDDLWMLIGEIHEREARYTDAIKAYKQVTVLEQSPIAAEATAKIADIYRWHLNELSKAQETYTTLIQDYPESVIVAYARQQLDVLMKLKR
ncbi:tetratricopeptide repeat protein [Candidatus Poribacteria bacterium]|nr:tetratricopeptide repeat protein [Candidatus Poribacteria bacterium]